MRAHNVIFREVPIVTEAEPNEIPSSRCTYILKFIEFSIDSSPRSTVHFHVMFGNCDDSLNGSTIFDYRCTFATILIIKYLERSYLTTRGKESFIIFLLFKTKINNSYDIFVPTISEVRRSGEEALKDVEKQRFCHVNRMVSTVQLFYELHKIIYMCRMVSSVGGVVNSCLHNGVFAWND